MLLLLLGSVGGNLCQTLVSSRSLYPRVLDFGIGQLFSRNPRVLGAVELIQGFVYERGHWFLP